jgi:hypothetical protein
MRLVRGVQRMWPKRISRPGLVLAMTVFGTCQFRPGQEARGQTATGPAPAALPTFTDVTKSAGIKFQHSFGDNDLSNIVEASGSGCAFFDYDGDGLLDIYLISGCYRPGISDVRGRKMAGKKSNKLYRNNGDGTFTDVTDKAGVANPEGFDMACGAADYDNDGHPDLYITGYGGNKLFHNNGDGTFTDVTQKAGVADGLFGIGFAWLDYDNDGRLDLYVGNYLEYDASYRYFYAADCFPGPQSYKGQPDILFHNNGDGTFTDMTRKAGAYNPAGRAMGVTACDFDLDGFIDVFVANDAMENYFYRNNGNGTFINIAHEAGVAFGLNGEGTSAMGPVFGDVNGDDLFDLFVPDMQYGCLYMNQGDGTFTDATNRSGIAQVLGQYTSWSGNLFDYDNDGWLDAFVANGDAHRMEGQEDVLLRNRGDGTFEDVSGRSGAYFHDCKYVGRGSAVGDFDNDGDLDILILNLGGPAVLLRNDGGNRAGWLTLRLVGTRSNRDSIGATVIVQCGDRRQMSFVGGASGYLSQSDSRVHFGLGTHAKADTIEVRWPSGAKLTLKDVKADQFLTLQEPGK